MGVIRKTLSITSFGPIDLRSDKERIARSARRTDKAVREGNELLREQNRLLASRQAHPPPRPAVRRRPAPSLFDDPEAHLD